MKSYLVAINRQANLHYTALSWATHNLSPTLKRLGDRRKGNPANRKQAGATKNWQNNNCLKQ